ncbi:MAG: hypothetical protein ISR42_04915 [Acidimicrobiia bacterium]|nr:hypothetical protein [Acidimicrobiia bacterium]
MLLRESSNALDQTVDLAGTIGQGGESSVPHGDLLVAYAEAAHHDPASARELDYQMLEVVGPGGLVDAAATVAIFNGLVRSADATGIPLDEYVMNVTVDERQVLGLNDFSGSANS